MDRITIGISHKYLLTLMVLKRLGCDTRACQFITDFETEEKWLISQNHRTFGNHRRYTQLEPFLKNNQN